LVAEEDYASVEVELPRDREIAYLCGADGNLWAAAGHGGDEFHGVHVFAPNGGRIGQTLLPETCANICFGGAKRNRLFMAASQSIYAVSVET
jgi:gluconolactonase